MSSLNFPFNYGLGYYGCSGQSGQNCPNDFSECCFQQAGPYLTSKLNTSKVSFVNMNRNQQINWVNKNNSITKTINNKSREKSTLHKIPLEFSGVL